MITSNPDDIEERLEAHEADLNAIEISSQTAMTFAARSHLIKHPNFQQSMQTPTYNQVNTMSHKDNMQKPFYQCNNCREVGNSVMRHFAPGGGLAGQEPLGMKNIVSQMKAIPTPYP